MEKETWCQNIRNYRQEQGKETILQPEIKYESKHEHINDNVTEQFMEQFKRKITKEDTHTRQTWLIKNETIQRIERVAKGKRKGFKTELVNRALEMFLNRIEK